MKSSSPLRPKTFRFFVHHRKRKFLQIQKKKTLNVVSHLQFVFVLLVHLGQQLSFTAVQGVDERVALRHQTRLELHAVLLQRDVTNRSSAFYRQVMMAKTQLFSETSGSPPVQSVHPPLTSPWRWPRLGIQPLFHSVLLHEDEDRRSWCMQVSSLQDVYSVSLAEEQNSKSESAFNKSEKCWFML